MKVSRCRSPLTVSRVQASPQVGEERGVQAAGHQDPDGGDGGAPAHQSKGQVRIFSVKHLYFIFLFT